MATRERARGYAAGFRPHQAYGKEPPAHFTWLLFRIVRRGPSPSPPPLSQAVTVNLQRDGLGYGGEAGGEGGSCGQDKSQVRLAVTDHCVLM